MIDTPMVCILSNMKLCYVVCYRHACALASRAACICVWIRDVQGLWLCECSRAHCDGTVHEIFFKMKNHTPVPHGIDVAMHSITPDRHLGFLKHQVEGFHPHLPCLLVWSDQVQRSILGDDCQPHTFHEEHRLSRAQSDG